MRFMNLDDVLNQMKSLFNVDGSDIFISDSTLARWVATLEEEKKKRES